MQGRARHERRSAARWRAAVVAAVIGLGAVGLVPGTSALASNPPFPITSQSGAPVGQRSSPSTNQPTSAPSTRPTSSTSASPSSQSSPSPADASASPRASLALPIETTTPTSPVRDRPTAITFYGRGYGHGLGMSQYGARGRALAGQTAATILAHYYQGTTPATVSPSAPVRILVLGPSSPTAAKPLVFHGRGAPFTIDGFSGTFPVGAEVTIWRSGSGFGLHVTSSGGTLLLNKTTAAADLRIRSGADPGRIQVDSEPGAYDTYRATIRVLGTSSGVLTVNEIGLDLYLLGVVPAEMPSGWPAEALKVQAVAARSYAEEHVHVGIGAYDLFDDTRSQVYRGALGEVAATNAAVTATAGGVLKSGSAIINALYHSADGGATEDNENVYTSATGQIDESPISYLRGSSDRDPNGVSYDSASPHATWHTAAYSLAQLSAIFATDARTNVGTISGLDLSDKGVSGRPIKIVLTGSLGTKSVSAEIFREVFNAGSPAADPYMWSTLIDTRPIP
jgi:stage II sporulation protein D